MISFDKQINFLFITIVLSFCCTLTAQTESKFKRLREWSDSTGKFKVEKAKISLLSQTSVTIEKEDGTTSTIVVAKLSEADQEFVNDYKTATFNKVKADAKKAIFANDVVRFYTLYLEQGFANPEQAAYANAQIDEYKSTAANNAIILAKEVVPETELIRRQALAEDMVDQWIEAKHGDEDRLLKDATKQDPTTLESAILLAIYAETHEASFKASQRYLLDAVKRGKRYLSLATEVDRNNLLIAMNNLSVSYARTDQVPKALRMWMEADEISDYELPTDIKYNIAKMWRMLKADRTGMTTDRSNLKDIEEFVQSISATGRSGGWKLIFPTNHEGTTRTGLDFVVANREAQSIFPGYIQDTRCIYCVGHSIIDCLNRKCKNGKVENPIYGMRSVTFPDGTKQNTGRGIIRIDWVTCSTCQGKTQLDCPCCYKGMQKN